MYLPRSLLSTLYIHLQCTHHPLSSPVLILVALEPDALAGCRILTHLLKRDYIPHKIQPIAGYGDLEKVGTNAVRPMIEDDGRGGVVVCLGVGGSADLGGLLGIEDEGSGSGTFNGVEIWVVDSRRPWNLGNVFGGNPVLPLLDDENPADARKRLGIDGGRIGRDYKPGKGGIIVYDDGDIEEELGAERDAFLALMDMPEIDDDEVDSDGSDTETDGDEADIKPRSSHKRKSWSDREEDASSDEEDDRPRQRRRSNSVSKSELRLLITSNSEIVEFHSRVTYPESEARTLVTRWTTKAVQYFVTFSFSFPRDCRQTSDRQNLTAPTVEAPQEA